MNITDIFIKRPVLSLVLSILIVVLGLAGLYILPVRQYPQTQTAVLHVKTSYIGADAAVIAGFITTPLENAIAQANGIDYITSSSTSNLSTININLRLNYDAVTAIADVTAKINSVLNSLPKSATNPVISVTTGEVIDAMYLGFTSKILANNQITDYLLRVVQPKLQAIPGVQVAEIVGGKTLAMRIWLDPQKLAGFNLTAVNVSQALANNNFITAVGRTDGNMITANLVAETGLHSVADFRRLIIAVKNGAPIHLDDVATVSLGAVNYDNSVSLNNNNAVYIGIQVAPTANILTVLDSVKTVFPEVMRQVPSGLSGAIVYDASEFIASAIHEVNISLFKSLLIVSMVVLLFLGSLRAVVIPLIAVPISIIGSFFIMLLLGYSINLLTSLALLLAIGLVVDDAIIVVENIQRHIADGADTLTAALTGARELANPILAISLVLIAVYLPIGFVGGMTGALFAEFAFTVAGAVAISAVIALTLSPMMCAKLLTPQVQHNKFAYYSDRLLEKLEKYYQRLLKSVLATVAVPLWFAAIIALAVVPLFLTATKELAPSEDQGIVMSQLTVVPNASLAYTRLYADAIANQYLAMPEVSDVFQINGAGGLNTSIVGLRLKPWSMRHNTSHVLQLQLQRWLQKFSGVRGAVFEPAPLPGAGGLPVQFVIKTTDSFAILHELSQKLLDAARHSGLFIFLDSDLKIDKAQTALIVDRAKAADLGINMQNLGNNLSALFSQGYINYFNYDGRAYQVITQLHRSWRLNPQQLLSYYINSNSGKIVQLGTIAQLKSTVVPESLNHFQQLNAVTIVAQPVPGVSLSSALADLQSLAHKLLPVNYELDYAGQSRQFVQESGNFFAIFGFSLLLIFLCLAALFESFRDPLIILATVPLSLFAALIFINVGVGGATINIYTEVGLVTLVGIISKHGILIVQFANELQRKGKSKQAAIIAAAVVRLRPILMTTAAMVLGVFPLLTATGAGAASSFALGLVITAGISLGTLFTLFVVPAIYLVFAAKQHCIDTTLS